MKMKVIDLLNKSSKGEEMPKRIKYDTKEYFYCGYDYKIYDVEKQFDDDYNLWNNLDMYKLNDYVEIIEEDKKIEKLLMDMNSKIKGNMTADYDNYMVGDIVEHNFDVIHKKINELIDEVNKLKENRYENKM